MKPADPQVQMLCIVLTKDMTAVKTVDHGEIQTDHLIETIANTIDEWMIITMVGRVSMTEIILQNRHQGDRGMMGGHLDDVPGKGRQSRISEINAGVLTRGNSYIVIPSFDSSSNNT